ncbi:MAG TPA: FecR domain-containing protein [Gemmatimonadales bacterium]|nr:FecR domain-containing protein [Gemmatimonadales bacterium]
MPEPETDRAEALARLLAGESSPEEQAALRQWLAQSPDDEAAFRLLQQSAGRLTGPKVDVDAAWRRVAGRLPQTDAVTPLQPHVRWQPLLALAAVLALAVIGGLWAWQRAARPPMLAYSAPAGVPQVIPFDGGRMILAPRSRLVARHRAGMRPDQVRLEGEAWFEVAHDPARPFEVRVGDAVVTDLGTVFSVRGTHDGAVEVAVLEGSVSLKSASGQSVVIAGGNSGRAESGTVTRAPLASSERPDWLDGTLEFHDAPMSQVQAELRRWYGLELRLGDSTLAARHVTASFQGDSVARVLRVIALALGASVEQRGDTAVLNLSSAPSPE